MQEPIAGCTSCLPVQGATDVIYCSGGPTCEANKYPNTSGFLPLGHRLLVQPDSVERSTKSGIVLIQETTGRDEMAQVKGIVIAVGAGCWKDTTVGDWCAPGDRIVFGKYSGLQWSGHDNASYRILNDLDVVGLEQPFVTVAEIVEDKPAEAAPVPALENKPTESIGLIQVVSSMDEVENATR